MGDLNLQSSLFGDEVVRSTGLGRDRLAAQLYSILECLSLDGLVACITTPLIETIEYSLLLSGKKACQKTSLLFNPHRLDTVSGKSKMSIFAAMKTPSFCDGLARAMLFDSKRKLDIRETLYTTLRLGINGVQYCDEFQPYILRDLCLRYHLGKTSSILDPCGGWGGRMIGASATVDHYCCFEPSTRTSAGLSKLAAWLEVLSPGFSASVYQTPFEDSCLSDGAFDMAITSPPYYDTEKYNDEPQDSANRFHTFQDWADGFFAPLVHKTMSALKPRRPFILNIGSRIYPLSETLKVICVDRYQMRATSAVSLSGKSGLGKSGEGETFYEITGT